MNISRANSQTFQYYMAFGEAAAIKSRILREAMSLQDQRSAKWNQLYNMAIIAQEDSHFNYRCAREIHDAE